MFEVMDQYVILCAGALHKYADLVADGQSVMRHSTIDGMQIDAVIGYSTDQDAGTIESEPEGLSGRWRETYQIRSTFTASWGGTELTPLRNEIREMYNAVSDAVKRNPTLNTNGVLRAYIRFSDFEQVQTKEGATASLRFTLFVDAFAS